MRARRLRHGLVVTVIALGTLGCGGSADGSVPAPTNTAAPSVTSAPSASPSQAPATATQSDPPAGGPAELCAEAFEPCPIKAGTYHTLPFTVPFTFTIEGDGWTNDRNWPHGGSMTRADSDAFLWASGVTSGQVGGVEVTIGPTVDDFVAHLGRFEGWTLAEPVPVTVDGASGLQVDLTTNETGGPGMFYIAEDAFNLAPGEKVRFIALDKDGQVVILIIDAFVVDTFDGFVAEVGDPLLAGLTWE